MKSNWITATIDDVCTVVTDGAHNSPKSVEQGHYMASVKDFTEFGFDFSNCKQIGEEDYEKLRNQGCVPEKNDILVGKDGAILNRPSDSGASGDINERKILTSIVISETK